MNNKGYGSHKSYIAVIVILICALIFIFYLLNTEKKRVMSKPITEGVKETQKIDNSYEEETTTTTVAVDHNEGVTGPINVEPVSNFKSGLDEIIGDLSFFEDYNVTTYYHGVEFTFRCSDFDPSSYKCVGGSALMRVNNALYPLYTYTRDEDNYLLRGKDYYIELNDDMVILYTNKESRIFDLAGNQVGTIRNTLTSYNYNGKVFNKMYPNYEDGKIYYYACENNQVVISSADVNNYDNVETLETVEASCN